MSAECLQHFVIYLFICFSMLSGENADIIGNETCRITCKIKNKGKIPCRVKFLGNHCDLSLKHYDVKRKRIPKKLHISSDDCRQENDKVIFSIKWKQDDYKRYPPIDGYLINMMYIVTGREIDECYLIETNSTNIAKQYTFTLKWECNNNIESVQTKMLMLPNKRKFINEVRKKKRFPKNWQAERMRVPKTCLSKETKPCRCLDSFEINTNSTSINVTYEPPDANIESRVKINSFDGQIFFEKKCSVVEGHCSVIFDDVKPANYKISVAYGNQQFEDKCKCGELRNEVEIRNSSKFLIAESKQKPAEVTNLNTFLTIIVAVGCFFIASFLLFLTSIILRKTKMLGCEKYSTRLPQHISWSSDTIDFMPLIQNRSPRVMIVSCYEETNTYFADAVTRFADILEECSIPVTHFYKTDIQEKLMSNINDFIEHSVSSNSIFLFILTNQMFNKLFQIRGRYIEGKEESRGCNDNYKDVFSYTMDLIRRKRQKRCQWIRLGSKCLSVNSTESLRKMFSVFQDSKQWCIINGQTESFDENVWTAFVENIFGSTYAEYRFILQEKINNFVASVKTYTDHQKGEETYLC